MTQKVAAELAPHSWGLRNWPSTVWPHTEKKARYVVRANRTELVSVGALSRVGRELVVLGGRYTRWLECRASEVPGYELPMHKGVSTSVLE